MKSLVHLNALRAFEASARHQSFSAAATELHVTPAAVGQLVRTLEDWIGRPLFLRGTRGRVRLIATEVAERALPDIRTGLDRLATGLERLKEASTSDVLNVAVSPAFAAKWLLPRIDRFHAAQPDTDVRLDTNLRAVDFTAQRLDIGVRYGSGNWPGLMAEKLMDEDIYPVCSPRLVDKQLRFQSPQDLAHQTLIHDQSMDGYSGFPSWSEWLLKAGVVAAATTRGLRINNSAAVLQAAIDGLGVALARSVMAHDDVASGRLVRLFPEITFASPLAYFVVYRAEHIHPPKLAAFRDWLLEEAAGPQRVAV
jgi:LysR family glycine cleavage system transcriptional activator